MVRRHPWAHRGSVFRSVTTPLRRAATTALLFICIMLLGFMESRFSRHGPRSVELLAKTYHPACKWAYENENQYGYAPVANDGRRDLANYVCPSMFRDLSDYVYQWPYDHFGEHDVWVADPALAAQNLPPVPIIYSHSDEACEGKLYEGFLASLVRQPYILITGQSDLGVPGQCRRANDILQDPHLVMWFAQNNDNTHKKISPIPIGLNCFEQGPEMHSVLQDIQREGRPQSAGGVYVNFGHTHPHRREVWEELCERNKTFADCKPKFVMSNVRGNPHLVDTYKELAAHDYVASPRGNGLDCHRFWESLYLGITPIVNHSALDPLYLQAGNVLFVDNFGDVNEELLREKLPHFRDIIDERRGRAPPILTRVYWKAIIEGARTSAMQSMGLAEVVHRKRCWGLRSQKMS